MTIARADRRPVAVIDLAGDPKTEQLAKDLNPVLLVHPDLQPIPDPSVAAELFGEFRDDDQDHISNALTAKKTAEEQLARYSFETAQINAANGQRELRQVVPSAAVLMLYAQLAFIHAQALLGMPRQQAEAATAFALSHRLDPTFVPDAARYLPEVVQAFDAAKKRWTGKGTLAIAGKGRLWIDGKDTGNAPADVEVAAGPHVVSLTGAERVTGARQVLVEPGKKAKVEIPDEPADARLKVRRARAQLRYAPDPAARAGAMKLIAELVGVRDAVLLSLANGKVITQTWNASTRDSAPGFSALREMKGEKPVDLLAPLAPPKPKEDPPPVAVKKPIPEDKRWYERRPVQASIVVGVVAAIVAGYYLYQYATDDTVSISPDVSTPARLRW